MNHGELQEKIASTIRAMVESVIHTPDKAAHHQEIAVQQIVDVTYEFLFPRLVPVPMTQIELSALLFDMHLRVGAGDSFEGSLQYLMPTDEIVPDDCYALVQASYRIGNDLGQGGVRLIRRANPPPQVPNPHVDDPEWKVPDFTAEDKPLPKEGDDGIS